MKAGSERALKERERERERETAIEAKVRSFVHSEEYPKISVANFDRMWQALLAAAVAGSTGIVAKHLFKPGPDQPPKPYDNGDLRDLRTSDCDRESEPQLGEDEKDEVFRFSTTGSRNSRKKGVLGRQTKKGARAERSTGTEQRNGNARRFGVALKRRKICWNVAGNRGGSSTSQDTSLFGWGLGVGMMCMISAGKGEFSRLNTAVTETAKVVQELKVEIHKRESSRDEQLSGCVATACKDSHHILNKLTANNVGPNEIKSSSPRLINDAECASSVLTEEPAPGMQEMDQLEAELEFELEKLPWCGMEVSNQEDSRDLCERELLAQGRVRLDSDAHKLSGNGILPEELDQKLCHLLIEKQENQIEELESELSLAQRKLHEKEAELRALKDCVKRLTEVSLSTFSDDEPEASPEQEQLSDWKNMKVGSESKNTKWVGMKRPIDSRFM